VQTSYGAAADKPAGVVALTCFDLRRFGKVGPVLTAVAASAQRQYLPSTCYQYMQILCSSKCNITAVLKTVDPAYAAHVQPA
jgi:hypothetical protein